LARAMIATRLALNCWLYSWYFVEFVGMTVVGIA
jgi:hypothetical protein